jgi:hypothetical protein
VAWDPSDLVGRLRGNRENRAYYVNYLLDLEGLFDGGHGIEFTPRLRRSVS